jgi:hypothetical protein
MNTDYYWLTPLLSRFLISLSMPLNFSLIFRSKSERPGRFIVRLKLYVLAPMCVHFDPPNASSWPLANPNGKIILKY